MGSLWVLADTQGYTITTGKEKVIFKKVKKS